MDYSNQILGWESTQETYLSVKMHVTDTLLTTSERIVEKYFPGNEYTYFYLPRSVWKIKQGKATHRDS